MSTTPDTPNSDVIESVTLIAPTGDELDALARELVLGTYIADKITTVVERERKDIVLRLRERVDAWTDEHDTTDFKTKGAFDKALREVKNIETPLGKIGYIGSKGPTYVAQSDDDLDARIDWHRKVGSPALSSHYDIDDDHRDEALAFLKEHRPDLLVEVDDLDDEVAVGVEREHGFKIVDHKGEIANEFTFSTSGLRVVDGNADRVAWLTVTAAKPDRLQYRKAGAEKQLAALDEFFAENQSLLLDTFGQVLDLAVTSGDSEASPKTVE